MPLNCGLRVGFRNLQICNQNHRPLGRHWGPKGIPISETQGNRLLKVARMCDTVQCSADGKGGNASWGKAGRGTLLETGSEIEKPESVLLTLLIAVIGAGIQRGRPWDEVTQSNPRTQFLSLVP